MHRRLDHPQAYLPGSQSVKPPPVGGRLGHSCGARPLLASIPGKSVAWPRQHRDHPGWHRHVGVTRLGRSGGGLADVDRPPVLDRGWPRDRRAQLTGTNTACGRSGRSRSQTRLRPRAGRRHGSIGWGHVTRTVATRIRRFGSRPWGYTGSAAGSSCRTVQSLVVSGELHWAPRGRGGSEL